MRARSDGSRGMLQRLINARPEILQDALVESGLPVDRPIHWTSPLFSEDFRMYRDKAFLDRLNVQLQHRPLRDFWPARGPRWGGLGRCGSQVLLVEAATSMEAFDTACQASSAASFSRIDRALAETRDFLGATPDRGWTTSYYRFANRLAHLYLLRNLNGIDAKLVLVHFHDTNTLEPTGSWLDTMASRLGLPHPSNWIQAHVKEVFIDAAPLGDVEWPPAEPPPHRSAAERPRHGYGTPFTQTATVPRIVDPTGPAHPAVDPNSQASVPTMSDDQRPKTPVLSEQEQRQKERLEHPHVKSIFLLKALGYSTLGVFFICAVFGLFPTFPSRLYEWKYPIAIWIVCLIVYFFVRLQADIGLYLQIKEKEGEEASDAVVGFLKAVEIFAVVVAMLPAILFYGGGLILLLLFMSWVFP